MTRQKPHQRRASRSVCLPARSFSRYAENRWQVSGTTSTRTIADEHAATLTRVCAAWKDKGVLVLTIPQPQFVEVQGRKIAYDEVSPTNPVGTVLLITGLASNRLAWGRQREVLRQTYRVISMDPRDAGDSDEASAPYAIAEMADDAAALLRALGVTRAAVVGISMGGFIALELSARHPSLVSKLILIATSSGGKTHVRPRLLMTLRFLRRGIVRGEAGARTKAYYPVIAGPGYFRAHPEDLEQSAEISRYRPQTPPAFRRQQRACLRHDATSHLDAIRVPTLVLHGEADPLVRVENGRYLAQHIPGARLATYPGAGHLLIAERADEVNRELLDFLES